MEKISFLGHVVFQCNYRVHKCVEHNLDELFQENNSFAVETFKVSFLFRIVLIQIEETNLFHYF